MESSLEDYTVEIDSLLDIGDQQITTKSIKSILLLGNTGAGKTSLLALISQRELVSIEDRSGKLLIDLKARINENDLQIGHSYKSCTSIPNFYEDMDCTYWDCPGFEDNKSIPQEIANVYYMKKVFANSDAVKFVLVIPYGIEDHSKGQLLADLLDTLRKMVPDTNKLASGLSIVISKCPARYKKEHFLETLECLANENNRFQANKELLLLICKNSSKVELFKAPADNMDIDLGDRERIIKCIKSTQFVEVVPCYAIGNKACIQISKLTKKYQDQIHEKLILLTQHLLMKYSSCDDIQKLKKVKIALTLFGSHLSFFIKNFTDSINELIKSEDNLPNDFFFIGDALTRLKRYSEFSLNKNIKDSLRAWSSLLFKVKLRIKEMIDLKNEENKDLIIKTLQNDYEKEISRCKEELANLLPIVYTLKEGARKNEISSEKHIERVEQRLNKQDTNIIDCTSVLKELTINLEKAKLAIEKQSSESQSYSINIERQKLSIDSQTRKMDELGMKLEYFKTDRQKAHEELNKSIRKVDESLNEASRNHNILNQEFCEEKRKQAEKIREYDSNFSSINTKIDSILSSVSSIQNSLGNVNGDLSVIANHIHGESFTNGWRQRHPGFRTRDPCSQTIF